MYKFVKPAVAVMASAFLAVTSVHAQETPAPETDMTEDDVVTLTIGCIATYDTLLTQGKGGDKTADIKQAREIARQIYMEFSGEDETQAAESIRLADEMFPKMLAEEGSLPLEQYQQVCDTLFADEEMAAAIAPEA